MASVSTIKLIEHDTYNALAAADLAVVASGTATLETAIIGTPLIVVYRASQLNWRIFRPLIRVPFVGMPNLIADRQIAPELLQSQLNRQQLAQTINELMDNPVLLQQLRTELAAIRQRLGQAQASQRAAQQVCSLLSLRLPTRHS